MVTVPASAIGLDESLSISRKVKKEYEHTLTNCFFPKQALEEYAADGRLFCRREKDALLFLGDEGAYWQVFYFLREGADFPAFSHEKPLVINELDVNGKQLSHIRQIEGVLQKAGFVLESKNLFMGIDLKKHEGRLRQLRTESEEKLLSSGLRCATPETETQRDQILQLWHRHLKPTDIPFSHYDDRLGERCCVLDENDAVCSVIWWNCAGKTSEWRHIVTRPDHLHEGCALALLTNWAVTALNAGCSDGFSWCEERNMASRCLQEKIGSCWLGRQSLQYVLQ